MPYKDKNAENAYRKKRHAERMATDPEYAEKCREISKRYRESHREHVRAKDRERAAANPEKAREKHVKYYARNRERLNAYNQRYDAEHKEEIRVRVRHAREADPERTQATDRRNHEKHRDARNSYSRDYSKTLSGKESRKRYEQSHPEYRRQKDYRRRVVEKENYVENVQLSDICNRDNGVCKLCGQSIDLSVKFPNP